ncbi:10712_t:CDS:1 [Funneliformis geosporum]|uniref:10712_t:CDS:1 n=1 Tax=Funneliformis geosporum TaxID=1117311 RepID=A0A9W4WLB5_9GLOM|nr:10712_t:CDS:1 [Funneliformis geosporum]
MSEIKNSKTVSEIKEDIKKLNLGQVSELIEGLKVDFNIQETAMVQPNAAPAETSEKVETDSNVSIRVTEIKKDKGLGIIKIYGAIQALVNKLKKDEGQDISVIQAKKLAEEGERVIVEKVARKEAEIAKKELSEVGVEVELSEVK